MPAEPTAAPAGAGYSRGIGMMLLGIALFAGNDALGKFLVGSFSVGQILFIRSIASLLVMAPILWRTGLAPWRDAPHPRLQLLRVVFSTGESALFYAALTTLPLAEVITYYLAGPIYVTALSPFVLRERVGWRRWSAVLVGFVGVVLALHPSPEGMSWGALAALTGSFSFACLLVTTRKLSGTHGSLLITGQLCGALLLGTVMVLGGEWAPTGTADLGLLALLGLLSMAGYACVNTALRLAPASVVVPYQYTLIVWALIFGYVFFGEVVDRLTLLGAAVIVGAGLFIFLRERQRATAAPDAAEQPG
ncbi:DMT family transporter [Roseomonas sp. BN140053]|uniref:DMT family transporter n=1 Tax=Roseomonas sp. BN140053 TaxID=3391898 RepID=UPI0039EB2C33